MKLPTKLTIKKTDSVELKKVKKTLNELLEFHYQFHKENQRYLVVSGGCKLSKKYQDALFQRIMGGSGPGSGSSGKCPNCNRWSNDIDNHRCSNWENEPSARGMTPSGGGGPQGCQCCVSKGGHGHAGGGTSGRVKIMRYGATGEGTQGVTSAWGAGGAGLTGGPKAGGGC